VFAGEATKQAFERCLFEACAKSGWMLHAFVVMRNHYHLALETPEGNLVAGMHWLQATFATWFNRLRGERGHLFQGRYKALLVEEGAALGQVCHYIHLNPVRAGVVPAERLGEYRHGSFWYLGRPKARPAFLDLQTALSEAGGLADTPAGWRCYGDYLAWQAQTGPAGRNAAYACLSRGWALGTREFKVELIKEHALLATSRAWESEGAREIRRHRWEACLQRGLKALGRDPAEAASQPKSAPWKAALAWWIKQRSQAGNGWLAERLHMGRPEAVSVYIHRLLTADPKKNAEFRRLTTIV